MNKKIFTLLFSCIISLVLIFLLITNPNLADKSTLDSKLDSSASVATTDSESPTDVTLKQYADEYFSFSYPSPTYKVEITENTLDKGHPRGESKTFSVSVENVDLSGMRMIISRQTNPMGRSGGFYQITSAKQAFVAPTNEITYKGRTAYEVSSIDNSPSILSRNIAWLENYELWTIIATSPSNSEVRDVAELQAIFDSLDFY